MHLRCKIRNNSLRDRLLSGDSHRQERQQETREYMYTQIHSHEINKFYPYRDNFFEQ